MTVVNKASTTFRASVASFVAFDFFSWPSLSASTTLGGYSPMPSVFTRKFPTKYSWSFLTAERPSITISSSSLSAFYFFSMSSMTSKIPEKKLR